MKTRLLIIGLIYCSLSAYGQDLVAPLDGINYQAVAIDEDGNEIVGVDIDNKPLYNKEIKVRFTIDNGPSGSIIYYQDEHITNTDKYGLFSVVIGHGINTGIGTENVLIDIPWINGDQWLMIELDIHNDGNYRLVGHEKFMSVPFAFYSDDIADNAITTYKILDETIQAEDIDTGAVETSEILNETILAEDIATGAVETSEILNETIQAEDIDTGAVETSEILNETILAEDIATGAVETSEILNETIQAEDIDTGAVETSEILNETILAEDIATGAVETSEILNETILAEDIAAGAVETSEILNETILAEDIATGAVETSEILNETILAEDIAASAVETSEILNETILAEDIATGAVETSEILDETIKAEDIDTSAVQTSEILNGTILNEDISNGTIDLTSKVTGVLPAVNGGTGVSSSTDGGLLLGGGTGPVKALPQATDGQVPIGVTGNDPVLKTLAAGTGIVVTQTADSVIVSSTITGGVNANGSQSINIGVIAAGDTYISPAFPVPGSGSGTMGDIVLASIDKNLKGCMLTPYFFSTNTIKIAIFNGTGSNVNLGTVNAKLLIVQ